MARVSSDPQEIAPGLWVHTFTGSADRDSATRVRWQFVTPYGSVVLTYEEMCAFRLWFLGPEVAASTADPFST